MTFGVLNNGIIQSHQITIPWKPSEVTVTLKYINIPGLGVIPNDYKVATLTEQGGLYVSCTTAGANGAATLQGHVANVDVLVAKK